jgi:assimilatory nitrate reductase catalytic subunit
MRAPDGSGADTLERHAALQPWLSHCTHATLTLAGRDNPVLVFQGWADAPWDDALLKEFDLQLGLDDAHAMRFMDRKRGISKCARIEGGQLLGIRLAGETRAQDWLTDLMARGELPTDLRKWLMAPVEQPPAGSKTRGKVVCNCFDVSEDEIVAEYAAGADLTTLQARRKCGTSCGSCVPELKRLAVTVKRAA